MIHDIPKPEISPDFTIADIRKIREWNHERLKDATPQEILDDTESRVSEARKKYGIKSGYNAPKLTNVVIP